jgi:glycosyl-4,4'-diaponeurosporenoate acyltransferase
MISHLAGPLAVVLDFGVWLVIHVGASLYVSKMPIASFDPKSWLYRERGWEKAGSTYQALFRVRRWKELLPDGAAVSKSGFRKKRLRSSDRAYIRTFILETCRAELTHWLIFVFAPIFFLWNDWWVGTIMIAYGIAANVPCIIAQRYNRIRLARVHG